MSPLNNPNRQNIQYLSYNAYDDGRRIDDTGHNIAVAAEPALPQVSFLLPLRAIPTDLVIPWFGYEIEVVISAFNAGATTLNCTIKMNGTTVGGGVLTAGGAPGTFFQAGELANPAPTGLGELMDIYLWVDGGNCDITYVGSYVVLGRREGSAWSMQTLVECPLTGLFFIRGMVADPGQIMGAPFLVYCTPIAPPTPIQMWWSGLLNEATYSLPSGLPGDTMLLYIEGSGDDAMAMYARGIYDVGAWVYQIV
jgi:hypothetical protein